MSRREKPKKPAPKAKSITRQAAEARNPDAASRVLGAVQRVGRPRADGTRAGAKGLMQRVTFELPPHLAAAIRVSAAERGVSLSLVAAEAFASTFGLELEATG